MSDRQFTEDPAESFQSLVEENIEESKIKKSKFDYSIILYVELIIFPIIMGVSSGSWEKFALYLLFDLIILFNKRYSPLILLGFAISWGFIVYYLLTWIFGDSSVMNIIITIVSFIIGAVSVVLHFLAHEKLLKRINA